MKLADSPGRTIYQLSCSPAFRQDGLCLAATSDGLLLSWDGGRIWSLAPGLPSQPVLTAALCSNTSRDRILLAAAAGCVFRSRHVGEDWERSDLRRPAPHPTALVLSPAFAQDGLAFLATLEDGVFRSADGGRTWQAWNFGLLDLQVLALAISPAFEQDETLFAGTETGLYRSTNGGRAWREVGETIWQDYPDAIPAVQALAVSRQFESDGVCLAGTDGCGLHISRDRGETWNRLGGRALRAPVNQIWLHPEFSGNGRALILQNGQIKSSADFGRRWEPWPAAGSLAGARVAAMAIPDEAEPGDTFLAGLVDGRILRE